MLLTLIAAAGLGAMPVPLFAPRAMDVSGASVLAAVTGPAWTRAELSVDATGNPTACDVVASSGSGLLDRVGCARAMKVARFAPARNEAGLPVAARVRQGFAVNALLPDDRAIDFAVAVDRRLPGAVPVADLRVVTDGGGKIVSCAVAASSGMRALDAVACRQVIGVVRTAVRQGPGPTMSLVSVGFTGPN